MTARCHPKRRRRGRVATDSVAAVLLSLALCSCLGLFEKHPVPLSSKDEIRKANADTDDIIISKLPIEQYSLLLRFHRLKSVRMWSPTGQEITDTKLAALSMLNLTNVTDINLLNSRLVTDEGIRALSKIRSVKTLGLEGTALTDAGCEVMASQMRLTGANVANCPRVTAKGMKALGESETITGLTFSVENLTQAAIVDLLAAFKNVKSCHVVDTERKLDENAIKQEGLKRNIDAFVTPIGAMQTMGLHRP